MANKTLQKLCDEMYAGYSRVDRQLKMEGHTKRETRQPDEHGRWDRSLGSPLAKALMADAYEAKAKAEAEAGCPTQQELPLAGTEDEYDPNADEEPKQPTADADELSQAAGYLEIRDTKDGTVYACRVDEAGGQFELTMRRKGEDVTVIVTRRFDIEADAWDYAKEYAGVPVLSVVTGGPEPIIPNELYDCGTISRVIGGIDYELTVEPDIEEAAKARLTILRADALHTEPVLVHQSEALDTSKLAWDEARDWVVATVTKKPLKKRAK